MRLKTLILGAAMVFASAPAAAQTQPQVVSDFSDATIARLLLDVQANWQVEAGANSRSIYRASAEGGIVFTAIPRACDAQKTCRSLTVLTPFTRNDRRNLASLDAFISAFNDQNPSAKVYRINDGTVVLQSYLNAAGGISTANARAQLLVFGQNIVKLRSGLEKFAEGQ